jgi:hypothetical protein
VTGFQVATDAVINEAQLWEVHASWMSEAGRKANGLRFSPDEVGVFGRFFTPSYHEFVDAFTARCREADDKMNQIRDTLVHIAKSYELEEEQQAKKLSTLGSDLNQGQVQLP